MDRSNIIEHLLLSRCSRFNGSGDVLQFLEQRYSFTGPQKNYLVLESTDGGQLNIERDKETQKYNEDSKAFLNDKNRISSLSKNNKFSELKTKNEFKKFLQNSLKFQDNLVRKLNKLQKKDPNVLQGDITKLKICKDILKFEDFIEMNDLWNNYIHELLLNSKTLDVITAKLSSAEFIGSYFKVTHSSCSDNIGIEGIVIWESQTYILLIVPRKNNWKDDISLDGLSIPYSAKECIGGLRMIPKKKTRFIFDVTMDDDKEDVLTFEFIGDRMSIRSLDRANKKFKSHNVKDIDL